jgi:hypothetical protein
MHQSSSKIFQPGTAAQQRTKADEKHFSPAIANALVACCTISGKGFPYERILPVHRKK